MDPIQVAMNENPHGVIPEDIKVIMRSMARNPDILIEDTSKYEEVANKLVYDLDVHGFTIIATDELVHLTRR